MKNRRLSKHNLQANRFSLCHDALAQPFQTQSRQPQLAVLDFGDFVDVFQRHRADHLGAGVLGTANAALARLNAARLKQQP